VLLILAATGFFISPSPPDVPFTFFTPLSYPFAWGRTVPSKKGRRMSFSCPPFSLSFSPFLFYFVFLLRCWHPLSGPPFLLEKVFSGMRNRTLVLPFSLLPLIGGSIFVSLFSLCGFPLLCFVPMILPDAFFVPPCYWSVLDSFPLLLFFLFQDPLIAFLSCLSGFSLLMADFGTGAFLARPSLALLLALLAC